VLIVNGGHTVQISLFRSYIGDIMTSVDDLGLMKDQRKNLLLGGIKTIAVYDTDGDADTALNCLTSAYKQNL